MTKSKYEHPFSKVRARIDYPSSLMTSIPAKVVYSMRLKEGDSLEWIWITEGFTSYCKVVVKAKT